MPTLSRYFIRSALICLGVGFTIGAFVLSAKASVIDARVWAWLPIHIILLVNGWLVQLSIGVAYWILPRIRAGERGRRGWAWAGFGAMQTGLGLAVVAGGGLWLPALNQLLAPAFCIQVLGVGLFVVHALPRIRPAIVRATMTSS